MLFMSATKFRVDNSIKFFFYYLRLMKFYNVWRNLDLLKINDRG